MRRVAGGSAATDFFRLRGLCALFAVVLCLLLAACTGEIMDGTPPGGGSGGSGSSGGSSILTQCPTGQLSCDGECVDPSSDAQHCGACGAPCPAGNLCEQGSCTQFCAITDTVCGGACSATQSDPANCGSCGNACAGGQFCSASTCSATCAFQICEASSGLECADVQTNPRHCGACGAACAAGRSCVDGLCVLVCPEGRSACNDECVLTETSSDHCGSCGNACDAGEACIDSACGCPSGQALCGGACVDIQNNGQHCGSCDNACTGGSACSAGACVCADDKEFCAGQCVDTASDAAHCGACGAPCGAEEVCEAGACKPKSSGCSSGLLLCGSSCVDTQSSSSHCGGCDLSCPPAQSCLSGSCACPSGGTFCAASCVDTQINNSHCGGCDAACTGGRSCSGGSCECAAGQLFCGTACVNPQTSVCHCGECDNACPSGQTCSGGTCTCPSGQTQCGGTCIDTATNAEHCGGCDEACGVGQTCSGGTCRCPTGQTFCGEACIDTSTDTNHCGGCGRPCIVGQTCSDGMCTGGGGTGPDGCGGLVRGLTLSQIAVYQSVKIPVMNGMQEVAVTSRTADVVVGRQTLFRVFVTLDSGWVARDLSARVTVMNDGIPDTYFQKKTISTNSVENNPSTTFQMLVPRDKIQADTRYFVEIVECGTTSGTLRQPRFPAQADVALGTRTTGPLKVRLIPVQANGRLPDTSTTAQTVYKNLLDAMFPVSGVEISVGTQISTTYPINWSSTLDQVRSKRQTDAPASDIYYYGLLKPEDTFSAFCNGSCTSGIAYVSGGTQSSQRAGLGIGFADTRSAEVMAHELGHNHGRNHAPCGSGISGVDANYPHSGGLLGVWGYSTQTELFYDPATISDIMGYCRSKWVSDYTYRGFITRVATVNGATSQYAEPEALQRWKILLLDDTGPRWGLPVTEPALASGTPELAEALDASGWRVADVTVYRTEIADMNAAMIEVPEPQPGWHSIRVMGAPAHSFSAPVTVPPVK